MTRKWVVWNSMSIPFYPAGVEWNENPFHFAPEGKNGMLHRVVVMGVGVDGGLGVSPSAPPEMYPKTDKHNLSFMFGLKSQ